MAEEKDNAEEKDEGQPKRNTALLRLPFGLCKRYGIKIEDSWTPRDAWNALKGRRGIDPREAMDDYLDDREANNPATEPPKQDTPAPQISTEQAYNDVFGDGRNKLTKKILAKTQEGFKRGTPEMQTLTAKLFKEDHWEMENTKYDDDAFFTQIAKNRFTGAIVRIRNIVGLSAIEEGGKSIYAPGAVFYHESWHAVSHCYVATGDEDLHWSLAKNYKLDDGTTFKDALFADTQNKWGFANEALDEFQSESSELARKFSDVTEHIRREFKLVGDVESKKEMEAIQIRYREEHPEYIARKQEYDLALGKLRQKWSDLSDVVSGLIRDEDGICGAGHDSKYWTSGNRAEEAFAEVASAKAVNPESYKLMKKYIPRTVAAFESIYNAIKNGKLKPREV